MSLSDGDGIILRHVGSSALAESADGECPPGEGAPLEPPIAMVVRACDPTSNSRNSRHTGTTRIDDGPGTRTRTQPGTYGCVAIHVWDRLHASDGGRS